MLLTDHLPQQGERLSKVKGKIQAMLDIQDKEFDKVCSTM